MPKVIKRAPGLLVLKPAPEYLHAQQCKDKDEEDEQDEEGANGGYRVHEALNEVTHRGPVPRCRAKGQCKKKYIIDT